MLILRMNKKIINLRFLIYACNFSQVCLLRPEFCKEHHFLQKCARISSVLSRGSHSLMFKSFLK